MTTPFARMRTSWIGISAALVVVVLDVLTKSWAVSSLSDGHHIHVLWTLQFALTHNEGMAFSTGTNVGPFIGMVAIVVIAILLLTLRKSNNLLSLISTGCIIGGAIGNVLDRVFRGSGFMGGAVVDFIDFQWWPVFNVADIAIVCGAIAVAYSMFVSQPDVFEGTE
ncbi:MAG: signal peptidase II [Actinomycetota bacterium]|jgi:signal peptidase II